MRRSSLLTLAALGALISLVGGTGLFAALTDTARTGTNTVDSAALAGSADIQLATATRVNAPPFTITCGEYSEDLASGFFAAQDVTVGHQSPYSYLCIRNVGSQSVFVGALAEELTDVDLACTGDESLHGDTTCGGDQAGELSAVLRLSYFRNECEGGSGSGQSMNLATNSTSTAFFPGTLAPGEAACFSVAFDYPTTATDEAVQRAQSDRATWRFKFTAQS